MKNCPKCKIEMQKGKALENSLSIWNPREGKKVSKTGPIFEVNCIKCPKCGHSERETSSITAQILGDF